MKKILLLIFICSLINVVFAQPGKPRKRVPPPKPPKIVAPPPLLERYPASKTLTEKKAIERIIGKDPSYFYFKKNQSSYSSPNFLWKMEISEETTLAPKTLYKQYIEFDSGASDASIWNYLTNESSKIKKDSDIEKSLFSSTFFYDNFSLTIEKNILILTNEKNKEVEKFKVFLSKDKEKILKIQNLKDNRIYNPSEGHPKNPSIGLPSVSPKNN